MSPRDAQSRQSTSRSEPNWHGWSAAGANLHIGELPGRKQVVLYTMTHGGSVIHPLAYFKTPDDARTALDFLDKLARSGFFTVELQEGS